jgi:hypothetical protein
MRTQHYSQDGVKGIVLYVSVDLLNVNVGESKMSEEKYEKLLRVMKELAKGLCCRECEQKHAKMTLKEIGEE